MLEFIAALCVVIVISILASTIFLARFISSHTRKDRELNRIRDERTIQQIKRVEGFVTQAIKTEQLVMNYQTILDEKIAENAHHSSSQNQVIESHIEKLNELVKSDMIAARRGELIRAKETKKVLERIISITTMSRQETATSDMLALESVNNRIQELESILTEGPNESVRQT